MANDWLMTIAIAGDTGTVGSNPTIISDKFVRDYSSRNQGIMAVAELLNRVASGNESAKVHVHLDEGDGTAAAQTIACVQTNADADDTVTVCGVVFTVKASPSSEAGDGEFKAITDDDTMAAALGVAINAHPALKGILTASVTTDTATLTMATKGAFGNCGTLATSDATAFTLGAADFAAGANGTLEAGMRVFRVGRL